MLATRLPTARRSCVSRSPASIWCFRPTSACSDWRMSGGFFAGESSDRWHSAGGGGVWFSFVDRAFTLSMAVAKGAERTGLYFQAGFGY